MRAPPPGISSRTPEVADSSAAPWLVFPPPLTRGTKVTEMVWAGISVPDLAIRIGWKIETAAKMLGKRPVSVGL